MSNWLYKDEPLDEEILSGFVGIVYCIENIQTNKRYIGKKILKFTNRKKIKGRVRSKRVVKDSDWRTYYGSSKTLLADVKDLGKENFKREILYFCKSKSEMSYFEAYEQFKRNAIISDEYYNDHIMVHTRRSRVLSESENFNLTFDA